MKITKQMIFNKIVGAQTHKQSRANSSIFANNSNKILLGSNCAEGIFSLQVNYCSWKLLPTYTCTLVDWKITKNVNPTTIEWKMKTREKDEIELISWDWNFEFLKNFLPRLLDLFVCIFWRAFRTFFSKFWKSKIASFIQKIYPLRVWDFLL